MDPNKKKILESEEILEIVKKKEKDRQMREKNREIYIDQAPRMKNLLITSFSDEKNTDEK